MLSKNDLKKINYIINKSHEYMSTDFDYPGYNYTRPQGYFVINSDTLFLHSNKYSIHFSKYSFLIFKKGEIVYNSYYMDEDEHFNQLTIEDLAPYELYRKIKNIRDVFDRVKRNKI